MNHEQQIEDLQRELIRFERQNRILREANLVAGERLRSRKLDRRIIGIFALLGAIALLGIALWPF